MSSAYKFVEEQLAEKKLAVYAGPEAGLVLSANGAVLVTSAVPGFVGETVHGGPPTRVKVGQQWRWNEDGLVRTVQDIVGDMAYLAPLEPHRPGRMLDAFKLDAQGCLSSTLAALLTLVEPTPPARVKAAVGVRVRGVCSGKVYTVVHIGGGRVIFDSGASDPLDPSGLLGDAYVLAEPEAPAPKPQAVEVLSGVVGHVAEPSRRRVAAGDMWRHSSGDVVLVSEVIGHTAHTFHPSLRTIALTEARLVLRPQNWTFVRNASLKEYAADLLGKPLCNGNPNGEPCYCDDCCIRRARDRRTQAALVDEARSKVRQPSPIERYTQWVLDLCPEDLNPEGWRAVVIGSFERQEKTPPTCLPVEYASILQRCINRVLWTTSKDGSKTYPEAERYERVVSRGPKLLSRPVPTSKMWWAK